MNVLDNTVLKSISGGDVSDLEGLSPQCATATLNGIMYLIEHNKSPLMQAEAFYSNCSQSEIDIINKAAWPIWKSFIEFAQDLMKIAN